MTLTSTEQLLAIIGSPRSSVSQSSSRNRKPRERETE
jgi:hypothetical protein